MKRRIFLITAIFMSLPSLAMSAPAEERTVFSFEYPSPGGTRPATPGEPVIGLALGGGGSRGAAHIGVLEVFEEKGIPIGAIAGASFGALVGGLYSCGYSAQEVRRLVLSVDWDSLLAVTQEREALPVEEKKKKDTHLVELSVMGWSLVPPLGLNSGQKLGDFLDIVMTPANYTSGFEFDSLRIPYRAVASNLTSGTVLVFSRGSLSQAVQASLAIPILFPPVEYQGALLVDGTLAGPLPVDIVKEMGADIVIGVDVSPPPLRKEDIRSALDVMVQSLTFSLGDKITSARSRSDVLIRPKMSPHSMADFSSLSEDAEWGRAAALESLSRIERAVMEKKQEKEKAGAAWSFPLTSVQTRGASHIPEAEILRGDGLSIGEKVGPHTIKAALASIYSTGFFRRVSARGTADPSGGLRLTVIVEENFLVKKVLLDGVRSLSHGDVLASLETREGRVFSREAVERDKKRILSLYRKKGYSLAEVRTVGISEGEGRVTMTIDEGRIAGIRIDGNSKTGDRVLLDEIETSEGEAFNVRDVRGDIRRLYALGIFERVGFTLGKGNNGVIVSYKVMEKPSFLLGLGIRGDTDEGLAELLDLRWENYLGLGSYWSARFLIGARQEYRLGYFTRRIAGSFFGIEPGAFFTQRDRPLYAGGVRTAVYRERGYGGVLRVIYEMGESSQIFAGILSERIEVVPIMGSLPSTYPHESLGGVLAGYERDNLDDRVFPTSGTEFMASLRASGPSMGGSRSFFNGNADVFSCVSAASGHTFGISGGLGFGSLGTPLYEKFTLGGMSYIPGYRQLIGYSREEFLGRNFAVAGVLYRVTLFSVHGSFLKSLYGLLHVRIGGAWDTHAVPDTGNFHPGAGAGLHLSTLFGPMRLDGGVGEAGRWALYFTAGYSF